jgi:benzoyl-CoA-dihydrodiol lyase
VFCTLAEGIKGKRAKDWNLVDHVVPRSKFDEFILERARALGAQGAEVGRGPAVQLPALEPQVDEGSIRYRYVELSIDRDERTATLSVTGPDGEPGAIDAMVAAGAELWSLRAFRELDAALLHLRFNEPEVGVVVLRTAGDPAQVVAHDRALVEGAAQNGFLREVMLLQARVLRRLDNTARSFYAVADTESNCWAGTLLEMALSADRFYMLEDDDEAVGIYTSLANAGAMPTASGLSRLAVRFYADLTGAERVLARGGEGLIPTAEADELGIATIAADDIDFEDELRIALEERASLSPDALTGMEASLRFPGPETLETKIFGRLSAWQNWIFTRPNAVGDKGALTLYGRPERPSFNWKRT